jgi:hypothetical protein
MKAITITASGLIDIVDKQWDYKDIYQFVGGTLEAVNFGSNDFFAYVNEESKILNLPVNHIATDMWYDSGQIILLGDFISGNAVLFGEIDEDGYKTEAPSTAWIWAYNTQESLIKRGILDPSVDPTNKTDIEDIVGCDMCDGLALFFGSLGSKDWYKCEHCGWQSYIQREKV